mmetsp:Transcript_32536/g.56254  ORF Transcript_32536/g.56254 Transcript_32536/m.56254 type:complete len:621 (+) Transcript_32536:773-2635(+)
MGCGKSSTKITEPKNIPPKVAQDARGSRAQEKQTIVPPHAQAKQPTPKQSIVNKPPPPQPPVFPQHENLPKPPKPSQLSTTHSLQGPQQSTPQPLSQAPPKQFQEPQLPQPAQPPPVKPKSLPPLKNPNGNSENVAAPASFQLAERKDAQSDIKISASNFVRVQMGGLSADYEVQEVLGQGGFAVVNKCVHKPTGHVRAVKIVHKSGLSYEQVDAKYRLREIKVLRSLDHPNILRCHELFEDRSRFYIVMEYCQGGELFDAIARRRTLTEAVAAKIMYQLLSCIAYCHEKKVIHRDLKPENILLEELDTNTGGDWNVKVADFGSSAFIDRNGNLTGCFGSAYYVAPEVVDGKCYNEKCDLWSAGIIMFIMLTGKPPYAGSNERQILDNVRRAPFNPANFQFQGISSEAIDLIVKLLKVDTRDRISAKEAVIHPWIQLYRSHASTIELSNAISNLRGFNATYKLKDAVFTFLATNVIAQSEMKSLRESFQAVDANSDGRISREELLKLYLQFTAESQAREEVEKILSEVDSDRSGFIDYSEFIKACMNHERAINKSNLKLAFQAFDVDGSGQISASELREVLSGGESLQEDVWREIIQQVDSNGDGTIDLKEFTRLMMNKI